MNTLGFWESGAPGEKALHPFLIPCPLHLSHAAVPESYCFIKKTGDLVSERLLSSVSLSSKVIKSKGVEGTSFIASWSEAQECSKGRRRGDSGRMGGGDAAVLTL